MITARRPELRALLLFVALLALGAGPAKHPGPLGLEWGRSPADARSILGGKLTLDREEPADEAPYDTIDQYYTGVFGGLETTNVMLRFHKGEFFYMLVKLKPAQAGAPAASPTYVFDTVVTRMREAYGEPTALTAPPTLGSERAIYDNLPLEAGAKASLPYLWNEQLKVDPGALYRLRDQQILLRLWDPFAAWRFANDVVVQTFMWQELDGAGRPSPLIPVWVFARQDRFKRWRSAVGRAGLVPPRDF